MMIVETKDWKARINRMPGDNFFRVEGVVTVPHSAVIPKLVIAPVQDKSFDLRMELTLDVPLDIALNVLTDKKVTYKVSGNPNVTGVSIFFEGDRVHHIDEIYITD
ncbi:hypothetical protein [Pseudomonas sp. WS 5071]|uniref:hypothetical protein n=1 Tax=Pseudomonas sp. WS 5071 TaxID=2717479 RepID=UPI0031FC6880